MNNIVEFLKKTNTFAVVGVSRDKTKYGYKVFVDLINAEYRVYAINPNIESIDDHQIYPSLDKLPSKPDVLICVVPPKVTEQIVRQAKDLGINMIWMQPGSESKEAIEFCDKNDNVLFEKPYEIINFPAEYTEISPDIFSYHGENVADFDQVNVRVLSYEVIE